MFSHINDVINNSAKVSLGGGKERAAHAEGFLSGSLIPELSCYFLSRSPPFPLPRNLLASSLGHGLQPALCKIHTQGEGAGSVSGREQGTGRARRGRSVPLCAYPSRAAQAILIRLRPSVAVGVALQGNRD